RTMAGTKSGSSTAPARTRAPAKRQRVTATATPVPAIRVNETVIVAMTTLFSRPLVHCGLAKNALYQRSDQEPTQSFPRERRLDWAALLRRVFGLDVLRCASCGGRMRVIAFIQDGEVSKRILGHLGLLNQQPEAWPARAPPTPCPGSDAELVFD